MTLQELRIILGRCISTATTFPLAVKRPTGFVIHSGHGHQVREAQIPSEESAVALLFGLIASGQIQLRRIDGYQRLSEVLEHAEVAA